MGATAISIADSEGKECDQEHYHRPVRTDGRCKKGKQYVCTINQKSPEKNFPGDFIHITALSYLYCSGSALIGSVCSFIRFFCSSCFFNLRILLYVGELFVLTSM